MSSPPITAEQLAALPPDFRALVLSIIDYYEGRIAKLEARIDELEGRTPKTPQNSSLPPSTQHPHAKPPTGKPKSKRKRGGQPGHPKHHRPLLPSEKCDDVQSLKPSACRRCGEQLSGRDADPLRHQVWELPEIKPLVTEYQLHRLTCPGCGETTCAALPPGVPQGQSGPRLVALAGLLMAHFRQSKRRTALFLEALLNQPCCPSLTVKMQAQVTQALRPAYEQLVAQLPTQPRLGMDESPTKEGPRKAWLWTAVAEKLTVFGVRLSRAATLVEDWLGPAFGGVITCDRAKMYWAHGRLQWCWAHLKRDFQALADSDDGKVKRLGHDLLRPIGEMFQLWGRYRDGALSRRTWVRRMAPIRRRIDGLLLRGAFADSARLQGMCEPLYAHRQRLWTFVDVPGIEPTNNASERALRQAVIWRKLSFGTQSRAGSRFVETLLTTIETCRQQQRNVFEFVTQSVAAYFAAAGPLSLLPGV